ncbi:T9SS type A sorting domain-containing protein [Saprospiraceae bacterium]|nr:T9SS type A sorting domain-containing protein [Saprospiraceae bacterium]
MAKNRREFLKNTALSALGIGVISKNLGSEGKSTTKPAEDAIMCEMTTLDFYGEGPFYTDNPPMIEANKLAADNEAGEKMIISGRVLNLDCDEFIPNTIVDVWHADDAGGYDNNGFKLRGFTKTNEQGFYLFETIKPGKYLNGASFRPSHIHYKITPPNFPQLTTQLYFSGDDSIPGDAAASITSGQFDATNRIIDLTPNAAGVLEGTFDIIIDGDGITVGVQDIHIDKGMVYEVSPNPVTDELKIHYGVFKKAKVGLIVYDMQGREVAVLEDEVKTPEKYFAYWKPGAYTAPGHYFVALKINDLQVHYMKVVKK